MRRLATITRGKVSAHLFDDGIWYGATDLPIDGLLASSLNVQSPQSLYRASDGDPMRAYQLTAQEQANDIGAEIELTPLEQAESIVIPPGATLQF